MSLVLLALVVVAHTRWFEAQVATRVQQELGKATGLRVTVGPSSFSLASFTVRVESIDVQRPGTPRLAHIDAVEVTPSVTDLLRGRVQLTSVNVDGGEVDLRFASRDGSIQLINGPVTRSSGSTGSSDLPFRDIAISDVRVKVDHPVLGRIDLSTVDLDLLNTPNRRLMIGLMAAGGEVHNPQLDGPVERLEARLGVQLDTGAVHVALAHVVVNHIAVQVREADYAPRDQRVSADLRVEGPIPDFLRFVPVRHPPMEGDIAVDARGRVDLATGDFEARATIDGQGLGLFMPDSTTGELLRYGIGERVHLRAEANRQRVIVRDFAAQWAGADVTTPELTIGLQGPPTIDTRLHIAHLDFTKLMRDLTVTPRTIVLWTLNGDIHLHGGFSPLRLVFDMPELDTQDFSILRDYWQVQPQRPIVHVPRAKLSGQMVIDDDAVSWRDCRVWFGQSNARVELVRSRTSHDRTGREKDLTIVGLVADKLHLPDVGTLADLPVAGDAYLTAHLRGDFGDPPLAGTARFENFHLNGLPFGNLETAPGTEWHFRALRMTAALITGRHRRSPYSLHDAYLDFSRWTMTTGATVRSPRFELQDFYNMFQFEGDPVFEPYDGRGAVEARVDYVLGRPGDDEDGVMTVDATLSDCEVKAFDETILNASSHLSYVWLHRNEGIRGARVMLDYFRGTKGGAPLEASGTMDLGGRMHFVASARDVPIASLDLVRASNVPVSGTATLLGTAQGTPDAPRIVGDLSLRNLVALGRNIGAVDIHLSQTPEGPAPRNPGDRPPVGRVDVDARLLDDRLRLVTTLRVPWVESHWRDTLGVDHRDHSRAWPRTLLSLRLTATEAIDVLPWLPPTLLARVGADATARARFDVAVERARLGDLTHGTGRVVIDALEASAWGVRGQLGEGAPLVVCADRGLFWVAPPTEREGCGEPPSWVDPSRPRGLTAASAPAFDLERPLLVGPGGVRLWLQGGGTLDEPMQVAGSVRGEVDLARVASFVPSITYGRGSAVLEASMAWDGERPNLAGALQMSDAAVGLAGLPTPVSDIDVDLRLQGSEAVLARAQARYGAALVNAAGGRIHLEGSNVDRIDVPVHVRNLVLTPREGLPEGLEVGLDADMTIARNPGEDLALVTGDLSVTRGRFTRAIPLSLDLAGRIGRSGGGSAPETHYDPRNDLVRFDVRVHMPTPFRVVNNLADADIRLGADRTFTVVGTNQRMGVLGTLEIPRGVVHFNESDFEIRRGRIEFDNPERVAPNFDVRAQTEIRRTSDSAARSQWRVGLHAYGTPDQFALDMTAEPALSQEDILLLLLFRLTRAEMERIGSTNVAQTLAIEALARGTGIDRYVQRAIPIIDEFRPGSAYNPRTNRTEPMITLGRRLTDWLRLGGMFTFSDQPQVRATADVRFGPRTGAQVFVENAGNQAGTQAANVGVDLRWRLEFR